jgi:hypothetical protein
MIHRMDTATDVSTSGTPTGARRVAPRTSVVDSGLARVLHAPASWLVALVGLSTLLRAGLSARVPTPWILPDELVYSELAKSIAAGHRPAVRGVPVFGWGEIYPTLIAPAWALVDDPVHAYHVALGLSALVMSFAAVPAYLLARLFVSRRASFLVASMTVLVPSMAYTGVVMTENAFYPVFLLAVFLIARAVQRPSAGRQALAVLGLGLVAFTRIQGLALVGAYLLAIVLYALTGPREDSRRYLRRFLPTAFVLLVLPLAPVVASVTRGDGAFGWLGTRSSTFATIHAHEVPEWFLYLTADLVLYVALVPLAASVVVAAHGLRRGATERVRLFAAVAIPTFVAMLGSVSLVSASLDVDGTENLNERYVFYVVPLMFIGLALWIRGGMSRRRPWVLLLVAGLAIATLVLPIDRLHYNSGFQSLALVPWISLSLDGVALSAAVGAFTLACGALWLTCARDRTGRLWLLVGIWMCFVGLMTLGSNSTSARDAEGVFGGHSRAWVDDAIPAGVRVPVVWDQNLAVADAPDAIYFWVMATEFFNPSVGDVYRLGPKTYYETFLPTVPARLRGDGGLVDADGRRIDASYVLVSCRTAVAGKIVARLPGGMVRLVKVERPLRLSSRSSCKGHT